MALSKHFEDVVRSMQVHATDMIMAGDYAEAQLILDVLKTWKANGVEVIKTTHGLTDKEIEIFKTQGMIPAIKEVRANRKNASGAYLGLKEAKELVDGYVRATSGQPWEPHGLGR